MGPTDRDGRSVIVEHALALLDDVHPEDLSIREVARRAGLSSGAPYHHFKTRNELLAACAVVAWTNLAEVLEPDDGADPRRQLSHQAAAYLRFGRAHPGPYQLITSRLFDTDDQFDQIAALRFAAMGAVADVIVRATEPTVDHGAAKLRGLAMWSMLHGHLSLHASGASPESDEAIAELATRMAVLPAEDH